MLGCKKAVVNNGRIVQCEHLYATITEQDYFILRKCYKWRTFRVANFIRYKKGYLPTDFVKSILKLYVDKTRLKDVEGEEVNYLKSKEMVNAIYGMTVTDIVRDELTYIEEWGKQTPDFDEAINKYNSDNSRFMFFHGAFGLLHTLDVIYLRVYLSLKKIMCILILIL